MPRTYVVTGSASGIGEATRQLLIERGHTVIGVDLKDADIEADLATAAGRASLAEEVAEASGGSIDAVLAIAGVASPNETAVAVNFFGTIATLENLRPLLAKSAAPRAVAVTSMASLYEPDDRLLTALLDEDEPSALDRARQLAAGEDHGASIYGTTKRALARWIRRNAATQRWAGESIPLNAIAPGVVRTPMTAELTATPEASAQLAQMVPMPLNGFFEPRSAAYLLAWLSSEENAHLCGQVIFIDGGSDAVIRGDTTW